MKTVAAATLGCKVNFTETEGVLELFRRAGYAVVEFNEIADVYVVNTCAVTGESGKKSRQMIARAKKRNPSAVVAAIGCYSQVSPGEVNADVVVGTKDRGQVVSLVEEFIGNKMGVVFVKGLDGVGYEELPIEVMSGRTRAFVKIQDGCTNFCAYCIIPYARGAVRSRVLVEIRDEIEKLVRGGCKEVVLSGIHIASYGKDFDGAVSLIDAVKAACDVEGIERVRLGSLDPAFVTDGFVEQLRGLDKVCPHFHLPLQSGCDSMLKRMNRRYDCAQYERAAGLLRAAFEGVSITTDIIAGFPGETDEDFNNSYSFIEKMELSRLHVFPFSKREGTAAARMDGQVSAVLKKERSRRLIELGKRLENHFKARFEGAELQVLVEEEIGEGRYRGLSENYIDVCVPSNIGIINEIVSVRVDKNDCFFL